MRNSTSPVTVPDEDPDRDEASGDENDVFDDDKLFDDDDVEMQQAKASKTNDELANPPTSVELENGDLVRDEDSNSGTSGNADLPAGNSSKEEEKNISIRQ